MTFEQDQWRGSRDDDQTTKADLARQGIVWMPLAYHKRPPVLSTAFDVAQGVAAAVWEAWRTGVRRFHGRGTVAAAVAYLAARIVGGRFFNDADGPLSQEYVDAGLWGVDSLPHRLTGASERRFLCSADFVAVLTERRRRGVEALCAHPPWVLPCAVDTALFRRDEEARARLRSDLGLHGTVLVYAGKAGGWYLTDEMLAFVTVAADVLGDVSLLILTTDPPERFAVATKTTVKTVFRRAARDEMPGYLSAADAGLSFILAAPSKKACSPVKNGEYLACGLPIVTTAEVGDYSALVAEERVGVVVKALGLDDYRVAARELQALLAEPDLPARCRKVAERHVGLTEVVLPRYREVYDLFSPPPAHGRPLR